MTSKAGWRAAVLALLVVLPALAATGVGAEQRAVIESKAARVLQRLTTDTPAAEALLEQAAGVLVFPELVKMGFGVGGQYGEGVLLVKGEPVAYYASAGASFGLQLGAQTKAEVLLFMTQRALVGFRNSQGWEAGVDAAVALAEFGDAGRIDTSTADAEVVGFILSNQGLMYDLSFEGGKITRIAR
jgi:lipid-binding SYLF domain-containing protein